MYICLRTHVHTHIRTDVLIYINAFINTQTPKLNATTLLFIYHVLMMSFLLCMLLKVVAFAVHDWNIKGQFFSWASSVCEIGYIIEFSITLND